MIGIRLLMGGYLYWIFAPHRTCCMIIYYYISSRKGRPRHLVVVGWAEEEVLLVSPVVELSGALGCRLVVGLNMLVLPPVPHRMCRVVVWSIPCLLWVHSLVGSSVPTLLWVGFWVRVGVWAVGAHEYVYISGEAKVCIFVATQIQLLVPVGLDTSSDRVVELNCVQVSWSTYKTPRQGLLLCNRPSDSAVLLWWKYPTEEIGNQESVSVLNTTDYLMWSCDATGHLVWREIDHVVIVGGGIVPVLSGDFPICDVRATHFQETYPGSFNYSILNLIPLWGYYDLGVISKEPFVVHLLDHFPYNTYLEGGVWCHFHWRRVRERTVTAHYSHCPLPSSGQGLTL